MTIATQLGSELKQQAANSRKVIERIPNDKLTWKPHDKSTPIGRLGLHIAELPLSIPLALRTDGLDFAARPFKPVFPNSVAEILEAFDKNLAEAAESLDAATDEQMASTWRATRGDQLIYEMSKAAVSRRVLDHIIHHRGQLTVYLRLLDIPVPPTFGPTADER